MRSHTSIMSSAAPPEPMLPSALRVYWMLIGNAVILLTGLTIARLPHWTPTWRDGLFAASLIALVWSRWVDATRYGGTNAQGDPVTKPMLVRWTAVAVAVSAGLWVLSQSIDI